MKSIEQRLQELEDESAIRSLVARFSDAATTTDYEAFKSLWADNGKWTIHEPFYTTAEGNQAIEDMLIMLWRGRSFFVQFVHSGVVQLNGDTATARWIMQEVSEGTESGFYNNYAIYMDSFVKSAGQWKFAQRDYHYIWIDTTAFPGDVYKLPALPPKKKN